MVRHEIVRSRERQQLIRGAEMVGYMKVCTAKLELTATD